VYIRFPILGGRLLKELECKYLYFQLTVSNPWREAIEDFQAELSTRYCFVSNPWREAIEVAKQSRRNNDYNCFQSLEGGY